ncbi:hypothetical protein AB1Y20_021859 [Prymnesium parvum]|uniref:Uncharacterized protein n=1 Tax=Prymnesium parvum TaxID=97485 RepID=A0AB34JLU0_PRYPA
MAAAAARRRCRRTAAVVQAAARGWGTLRPPDVLLLLLVLLPVSPSSLRSAVPPSGFCASVRSMRAPSRLHARPVCRPHSFWNADPLLCTPSVRSASVALRANGLSVVVVLPRAAPSASFASLSLLPLPPCRATVRLPFVRDSPQRSTRLSPPQLLERRPSVHAERAFCVRCCLRQQSARCAVCLAQWHTSFVLPRSFLTAICPLAATRCSRPVCRPHSLWNADPFCTRQACVLRPLLSAPAVRASCCLAGAVSAFSLRTYLPALNLALDVKTGSLFTSSATKAATALAAHRPLAATAETFLLRAFGDPRVASKGEYSRALAAGTSVNDVCGKCGVGVVVAKASDGRDGEIGWERFLIGPMGEVGLIVR